MMFYNVSSDMTAHCHDTMPHALRYTAATHVLLVVGQSCYCRSIQSWRLAEIKRDDYAPNTPGQRQWEADRKRWLADKLLEVVIVSVPTYAATLWAGSIRRPAASATVHSCCLLRQLTCACLFADWLASWLACLSMLPLLPGSPCTPATMLLITMLLITRPPAVCLAHGVVHPTRAGGRLR